MSRDSGLISIPEGIFPPLLTWKNKPHVNKVVFCFVLFCFTPSLCLLLCLPTVLGPLQLVVCPRDAEGVRVGQCAGVTGCQGVRPPVPRAGERVSPTQEQLPKGRGAAATSWSWEQGMSPAWEALSSCTGRGQPVGSSVRSLLPFAGAFPLSSCALVKAKDLKQVSVPCSHPDPQSAQDPYQHLLFQRVFFQVRF